MVNKNVQWTILAFIFSIMMFAFGACAFDFDENGNVVPWTECKAEVAILNADSFKGATFYINWLDGEEVVKAIESTSAVSSFSDLNGDYTLFIEAKVQDVVVGTYKTLCRISADRNAFFCITLDELTDEIPVVLTAIEIVGKNTINVESVETFSVKATYSDSTEKTISAILATDSDLITIEGNTVTGLAEGVATITATYQGKVATLDLTILAKDVVIPDATLTGITVAGKSTLTVGESGKITTTANYSDNTQKTVVASYISSNPSVVAVDASGNMVAKKAGSVTVTAIYEGKVATLAVEVASVVTLDTIEIITNKTELKVGDSLGLSVVGNYSDGSTKNISASMVSSNSDVLSIDESTMTAKKAGSATITALFEGKVATKAFTVKTTAPVVTLKSITTTASNATIKVGSTATLSTTASYSDGSSKAVVATYKSSSSCVTVSGSTVTAKSAGTATITASYEGKTATASITVKQDAVTPPPVVENFDGIKVFVEKSLGYNQIHFWLCDVSSYYDTAWPGVAMEETTGTDGTEYYVQKFEGASEVNVLITKGSGDKLYGTDMEITKKGFYKITSSGANELSEDPEKPATPEKPSVSISPSTGNISLNGTFTINVSSNVEGATATATIDGRSKSLIVGKNSLKVSDYTTTAGDKINIEVTATNSVGTTTASATLTTTERPPEPVTPTRLGAYYTSSATTFTIWSPDSGNVKVVVDGQEYTCEKNFKVDGSYPDASNIYGVTVAGDLHLKEYQFKINGKDVRDPYGKMVKYEAEDAKSGAKDTRTENGASITSYCGSNVNIVMDMSATDLSGGWAARPALNKREDAIVYEVHINDFTADSTSGVSSGKKGKYLGMVETGTTYSGVKTGIDHLKELGVTHVQILPFYDFGTRYNASTNEIYNWGYDPVNYNVPEDRYATDPADYIARVKEVKEMINEFHKNGIRVIMDVVYNHSFRKEMFQNISGKYYTSGDLSGCGNSTNSGVPMVSRMIRDSLEYWVDEYNIDGFRFDLIGIFHTEEVRKWGEYMNNTKFSDRTLLMYGEPWNGYATDHEEGQKVRMSQVSRLGNAHVGVFNGKFRESIKGDNDKGGKGYMFNSMGGFGSSAWNVSVGLRGSGTGLGSDSEGMWTRYFTADPEQTINYISAHDNYCLYDKITTSGASGDYAQRVSKFGTGIVLVSQGIPFIHAGDEMLRTKKKGSHSQHAHNSYMWGSQMNNIDWSWKKNNIGFFNYHRDLMALRRENDGFRGASSGNVGRTETDGNAVKYYVQNSNGTKLCVVVNPGNNINSPVGGTEIFNAGGKVNKGSGTCEGTAITVIKY